MLSISSNVKGSCYSFRSGDGVTISDKSKYILVYSETPNLSLMEFHSTEALSS
jgi:hypothetical protein